MSKINAGSAFGIGDTVIDPEGAVLLDEVTVAVVGTANPDGAGRALALNLEGRINHTQERADVLFLMDADGAAVIISELLGLADRVSPAFFDDLMRRVATLPRRHP